MAHATSTNGLREVLTNQFYNMATSESAAVAVFGDQGHESDGTPKAALSSQTSLNHQLIEVPISQSDIVMDGYSVVITGRLAVGVLTGSTISEFGIKINGVFSGIRNSTPKVKDNDEEIANSITFLF